LKMFIYYLAIRNILWTFGIIYDHLVHFFPVLVACTKKYLAVLLATFLSYEKEPFIPQFSFVFYDEVLLSLRQITFRL
jgi:hypothetical protein